MTMTSSTTTTTTTTTALSCSDKAASQSSQKEEGPSALSSTSSSLNTTTSSSTTTTNYFAIGAMMNPISIKNRKLQLEANAPAQPGFLVNHRLNFFGTSGFAEAVYHEGSILHGVVYRNVPADQMQQLDDIERDYIRKSVHVQLYRSHNSNHNHNHNHNNNAREQQEQQDEQELLIPASVYYRLAEECERTRCMDAPPSERYLQILIDGAKHFGVDPNYIQFLKDHPCRPRPHPSDYLSFPEMNHIYNDNNNNNNNNKYPIYLTRDQVHEQGNGENGNPLYMISNGRIIQFCSNKSPKDEAVVQEFKLLCRQHGHDVELFMATLQYDPQFGIPTCIEQVTLQHSLYTEHFFCEYMKGHDMLDKWRVIGRIIEDDTSTNDN